MAPFAEGFPFETIAVFWVTLELFNVVRLL